MDEFWSIWKTQYLLSLRERSQNFSKHPRIQSSKEPKVGDIVQIKESTPRGTWRIGIITELIESRDGEERAAKVRLSNKNILQRSLVHLYPLEIDDNATNTETNVAETKPNEIKSNDEIPKTNNENVQPTRTKRKTAKEARDKIYGHLLDE